MGIAERKLRDKERKRNLILDSAEKLIFTKGYKDTSIDDIAEAAEYSKGTIKDIARLYRYIMKCK